HEISSVSGGSLRVARITVAELRQLGLVALDVVLIADNARFCQSQSRQRAESRRVDKALRRCGSSRLRQRLATVDRVAGGPRLAHDQVTRVRPFAYHPRGADSLGLHARSSLGYHLVDCGLPERKLRVTELSDSSHRASSPSSRRITIRQRVPCPISRAARVAQRQATPAPSNCHHSRKQVDQTRSLKRPLSPQITSALQENLLHSLRITAELRMHREKSRNRPRHVRSSSAGTAGLLVFVTLVE